MFSMEPTGALLRSACEAVLGEAPADIPSVLCRPPLDREDCRFLRREFSLLGRSDAETQRTQLDEAVSLLRIRRREALRELALRERLALTAGAMAGLSLAVLLL